MGRPEVDLEGGGKGVLAEVVGQRAQVAKQRPEALEGLLPVHEVDGLHRRVLPEAVLEALLNAVFDAVLEVDDDLDLLGPAGHDVAEVAGHGEEGARGRRGSRAIVPTETALTRRLRQRLVKASWKK